MNSDPTVALSAGGGGGRRRRDKLSKLRDATLGHILSFLPADEAARAAVLSRRWRHVFAHVHTVSLAEPEPDSDSDEDYGYSPSYSPCRACRRKDRVTAFATRVGAALLARLRLAGGAAAVPLRALRVRFDRFGFLRGPHDAMVDMWMWHAAAAAAGGGGGLLLDLSLRRRDRPICDRRYALCRGPPPSAAANTTTAAATFPLSDAAASRVYVAPRSVFTCAALRTLRLGDCRLDALPSAVALPSLETLHLTGVAGGAAVQRLVSSCPRLRALTLEACARLAALSVPRAARLRALALRCCHDLAAVDVADASELRVLEYRGAVPAGPRFLTLRGGRRRVSSCTLDFCGEEAMDPLQLAGLRDMLQMFVGVERLHLTSARLGFGATALSSFAFPAFTKLRNLELTGILPDDDAAAIDVVAKILERTPNLETLSLFFMPELEPEDEDGHAEELRHGHTIKYDERASLAVPDVELPCCLRERVKEINFVHYQGGVAQRMLAKFLLCNAPAVQEVCGEFASGPLFVQIKLMEEIKGWVMNKSANMMFF